MARPQKKIDQKQFENLCAMQCTEEEICGFFEICTETLASWCKRTYDMRFSEVFAQKRGKGKISLRRKQWENAMGGNTTMQIWLGKQWLGQSDKVQTEVNVSNIDDESVQNGLRELRELAERRSETNPE